MPDSDDKMKNNAHTFNNATSYRHVVLLDDVVTTGSTVSEVARIMKQQLSEWMCGVLRGQRLIE